MKYLSFSKAPLAPLFQRPSLKLGYWLLMFGFCAYPRAGRAEDRKLAWDHSIVNIEVARKQYDYYQPWSRRTHRTQKTGLVYGDREILTTADELFDHTLIRLQKNGRGRWWIGEVAWIDYHANLALLTNSDVEFWRDLKPAVFGTASSTEGPLQVLRWREGKLENRQAEFTQFTVREGALSPIDHVVLEASSEIQGVGWGEPLVGQGKVAGIITSQEGRNCIATPASMIQSILRARAKGTFKGFGYFHFYWQPAENPASLARLSLPGEPRGVIISEVPPRTDGSSGILKPQDILLSIDGFKLDIQGDYIDPEYGALMLENLAVRGKWAGDDLKMQVWRAGKQLDLTYRLPKMAYTNALVPNATFDQDPEYAIVGGFVFQPLTEPFLASWGTDWKRRAPFRLNYYREESPSKKRPALVLLSQVLPDPYNIGYQEQRYLVLSKVNGQPVHYLSELTEALKSPQNGYHILEFEKGEGLQKIVISAGETEKEATLRVLKRYTIPEAIHVATTANN
jgi:hypothetical protein